jgi:hypothetical protein
MQITYMSVGLLLLVGVGLTVAGIERLPTPFIWAALLWVILLGITAVIEKSSWRRAVWVNLAAIVLALGVAEGYFWLRHDAVADERFEGSYTRNYFLAHELLGYAPARNYQATVTKYVGEELIYDTVYTIDAQGLRLAPPHDAALAKRSVLFFGGSITFGEGVDDTRTMPYQVGLKTQGRFAIYNFGFHGYGPHQMLAALQAGLIEELVELTPSLVIYQAIPAHAARSAGRASWDRHGPRYLLDERGNLYLAGHFDDVEEEKSAAATYRLTRSFLYQRLFGQHRAIQEEELRLYLAIVKAARDDVLRRFPGCAFEVLVWGTPEDADVATLEMMLRGLTAAGIPVHRVSDILPGYREAPEQYELSPHDRHPTAQAHERIAYYVVTRILGSPASAAP